MPEVPRIDTDELQAYITGQRWFASKAREVASVQLLDRVQLRSDEPTLDLALAEVRFQPGTHETYQLLLGGEAVYDALADPLLGRELVRLVAEGATVGTPAEGSIEFRTLGAAAAALGRELQTTRPVAGEQSNSSLVFDEALVLKAYRRVEAGINPELELLRFLTEHGFPHVPALRGWYAYSGPLLDGTLGIVQDFVPNGTDGWSFALGSLADDPGSFLTRVRRLGEVTGMLHACLASEPGDPTFCPEAPSQESLGLLTATIDEEIERIFLELPEDDEALDPIRGRGEEVRELLRLRSQAGSAGKLIRHHGDYHLGQVLWNGDDWVILDFEGEPARSIPERRRKRSPLRDVAGMLRSFAYAVSAARLQRDVEAPEDWEQRAREEFLAGYFQEVDPVGLLPGGRDATERLLSIFELEKAVYELRYELNNRPDWVRIPVAGIERLLQTAVESL
jgi:trehalose synthase-fused probable maltokinase